MSDWISVKDRLPEKGAICLVARDWPASHEAPVIVAQFHANTALRGWASRPGLYDIQVTHWMPLPPLPAAPAPGEGET